MPWWLEYAIVYAKVSPVPATALLIAKFISLNKTVSGTNQIVIAD